MNCRPPVVRLFVLVGLVPMAQTVMAATPTSRQVTATATILNATTNQIAPSEKLESAHHSNMAHRQPKVKYIGSDGYLTTADKKDAYPIIITDLP